MFLRFCLSLFGMLWFSCSVCATEVAENNTTVRTVNIAQGWNLLGGTVAFDPHQLSCASVVWTYDATNGWKLFGANITDATNYGYPKLEQVSSGEGYWVHAPLGGCTSVVGVDNNLSVVVNTQYFVDPFIDVLLSDVAGKTFQYLLSTNPHEFEYKSLTFNESGIATFTIDDCYAETNTTVMLKVENGFLNFYVDGNYAKSYKVLAADTTGVVFGDVNPSATTYSPYLPSDLFHVLKSGVTSTPVAMSTMLPYAYLNTVYEANLTYQDYTSTTKPFIIDSSGAIYVHEQEVNATSYNDTRIQIINRIGRYDILSHEMSSGYGTDELSYYADGSSYYIDLAQEGISTWPAFFARSGNRLDSNYYINGIIDYDNNISNGTGGTYEISSDGFTLTQHFGGSCGGYMTYERVFQTYTVWDIMHMSHMSLTSTTPIYKASTSTGMPRPISLKRTLTPQEIYANYLKDRFKMR